MEREKKTDTKEEIKASVDDEEEQLDELKRLLNDMEDAFDNDESSWELVEKKLRANSSRLLKSHEFFVPVEEEEPTSRAPLMQIFRKRPPQRIVNLILNHWPSKSKISLCTDENKRNILFHALIGGSPKAVIELIVEKDEEQIKAESHLRVNPLVEACVRASKCELDDETKEVIRYLMEKCNDCGISPLAHTIAVDEISDRMIHFILSDQKDDKEMLRKKCPRTNLPPLQTALLKGNRSGDLVARLLKREESLSFNILENLDDLLAKGRSRSAALQDYINYRMTNRWPVALLLFELYLRITQIVVFAHTAAELLKSRTNHGTIVALYVFSVYFFAREIIEFWFKGLWYIDLWNCVDASCVGLVVASAYIMQHYYEMDEQRDSVDWDVKVLLLTTGGFIVGGLVLYLRAAFYPYAIFVGGLIHILFTLGPFLVVSALMVFAFAFMNYMLHGDPDCEATCEEQEAPDAVADCAELCLDTLGESLTTSLQHFYNGPEPTGSWWLDQIFGIVFTVILLNVVIAIVSDAWEENQKTAGAAFWRYRIGFLAEIESVNRIFDLLTPAWLESCLGIEDHGDKDGPFSDRFEVAELSKAFASSVKEPEEEVEDREEICLCSSTCASCFEKVRSLFKAIDHLGRWSVFDETPWLEAPFESQIHNAEDYYLYNLRKKKYDEIAKWMSYEDYKKLISSGSFERNWYWASRANQSTEGPGNEDQYGRQYVKSHIRVAFEFFVYLLLMPLGLATLGLLWPRRIRENLFAVHEEIADRFLVEEGSGTKEKTRVATRESVRARSASLKVNSEPVGPDDERTNLLRMRSRMRKLESKIARLDKKLGAETKEMESKLDEILVFVKTLSAEKRKNE